MDLDPFLFFAPGPRVMAGRLVGCWYRASTECSGGKGAASLLVSQANIGRLKKERGPGLKTRRAASGCVPGLYRSGIMRYPGYLPPTKHCLGT